MIQIFSLILLSYCGKWPQIHIGLVVIFTLEQPPDIHQAGIDEG